MMERVKYGEETANDPEHITSSENAVEALLKCGHVWLPMEVGHWCLLMT